MDITITKTITTDGKFKLEVTGDYSGNKKTLDKIYNAVTDVVSGTADRISNANDVLAAKLWSSMQAHAEAKQEIKKLQGTLLKTILPCACCTCAQNRIEKFLNRGADDDENS